ncbi:MAG: class I SAM-dependent methyltransferase [Oligoflexia bacterium]|nr:class I SAM-dependent methyltransferase [Oligoflexia bacterium]MBF0366047.1 class I SAM-dependent methyltransferase [Oligoflexia bacterium]
MSLQIINQEIEEYCLKLMHEEESALLKELSKETYEKMQDPQMQVGRLEGSLLRFLTRLIFAKRVLEIGTFTGHSTHYFAEAVPSDGEVVTLDIDAVATEIAKRYWSRAPYGHKIRLILGDAQVSLKELRPPFDLIFIDADKENYIQYYESAFPLLRRGGLFIVDNVLWSGKVLDPKDVSDHAICKFNLHIQKDPRIESHLLTVRDGIYLLRKL